MVSNGRSVLMRPAGGVRARAPERRWRTVTRGPPLLTNILCLPSASRFAVSKSDMLRRVCLVGPVGGMPPCGQFQSAGNVFRGNVRRAWLTAVPGIPGAYGVRISRGRRPGHPCDGLLHRLPDLAVLCRGLPWLLGMFVDTGLYRVVPSPFPQVAVSTSEPVRWTAVSSAQGAHSPECGGFRSPFSVQNRWALSRQAPKS